MFLDLSDKERSARLQNSPQLPRPVKASLDLDGYLTWDFYSMNQRRPPKLQRVPPSLCFQFARLARSSDEGIVTFAKRWGPLNLEVRAQEQIKDWRRYATLAAALLRFASDRENGGRGEDEDWRIICEQSPAVFIDRHGLNTREQTVMMAVALNSWFDQAHGHGIVTVLDGDLQIQPLASNLFGILITQMAHVMARRDQMATCAGCRHPFTPKRPISNGLRRYCSRCRKAKVPQRDASRALRRRKAAQKTQSPSK
jgi:hypothetical protein